MLTVIVDWIYIFFTTYCLGIGFSKLTEKVTGYKLKTLDGVLLMGLVCATVYSQAFSLFGRVSFLANAILTGVCLLIIVFYGKQIVTRAKEWWKDHSLIYKCILFGLCVIWVYLTCQGYMHYDTDLYHAQSIRWIEEYGAVKGLSNLHSGYAYNSSLFATSALYSLKFVFGQSLHTVNGWVAFLLTMSVLDVKDAWNRKKLLLSDYACIASIYYLTLIADEVVSPASDYTTMCMIFYIVVKWLRQLESEDKENITPYSLLCVAGVYAMSLKLTSGLLLLLVLKPAFRLLKEKRLKEIFFYLTSGFLTAAVWMARTVILSGWLLYPFTALDFFNVDWKQPAWEVNMDAAGITTWGRAIYNASKTDMPITEWFGNWFHTTLSGTEKLLVLGNMAVIAVLVPIVIYMLFKKNKKHIDFLLVMAAVLASYAFWQFSAPLIRYGYAYVLLGVALFGGWVLQGLKKDRVLQILLLCYGVYKIWVVGKFMYVGLSNPFLIWQQDYNVYELNSFTVDGFTFYEPGDYTDRTGYDPFPAIPKKITNFKLRGEDLSDGFMRIEEKKSKKKKDKKASKEEKQESTKQEATN